MRRLAVAVALLPQAALAECTGQGCYSGLEVLIALFIAVALIVAALVITLVVLLIKKRWTAAKVVGAVLAVLALLALSLLF